MGDGAPVKPDHRRLTDEVLSAFRLAVSAGDRWQAVKVIFASPVFDGLCARLRAQWAWLPTDDVNQAVAEAFDALYESLGKEVVVEDPVLWLAGVSRHKAADIMRAREYEELRGEMPTATANLGRDLPADDAERRSRLAQLARGLLPRVGSANVQAVMGFYIDAVEQGISSLSYQEIAQALGMDKDNVKTWAHRGFRRISRAAEEDGLAAENFELIPQEIGLPDDDEQPEPEDDQ